MVSFSVQIAAANNIPGIGSTYYPSNSHQVTHSLHKCIYLHIHCNLCAHDANIIGR